MQVRELRRILSDWRNQLIKVLVSTVSQHSYTEQHTSSIRPFVINLKQILERYNMLQIVFICFVTRNVITFGPNLKKNGLKTGAIINLAYVKLCDFRATQNL